MGSTAPFSHYQQHPHYHHLRDKNQAVTNSSDGMDTKATKTKDIVTSVYPSPADEVISTFSASSSPVFSEQKIVRPFAQERITLPPISSIIQMPSPSSSPQLSVASYRSPATEAFLRSPAKQGVFEPTMGRGGTAVPDSPLFSDRPNTSDEVFRPQPLFAGLSRNDHSQPAVPSNLHHRQQVAEPANPEHGQRDGAHRTFPNDNLRLPPLNVTKRQRKRPVEVTHLRDPIPPGTPMYGIPNLWQRQQSDPDRYAAPVVEEWATMFRAPSHPIDYPPAIPQATTTDLIAQLNATNPSHKRKADSVVEMPPPKRRSRKVSDSTASSKPSVSPREALLDKQRRTQDTPKAKAPRAPSEKVSRDYSVYPDYCPPLSTLDSDQVTFPNVEWKAAPQDMSNHEDVHLLHPKEVAIASKLVLSPSIYLYIKRRFFAHRLEYARKGQVFNINAAQLACKGHDGHGITGIDVNKTSRLHKAFDKVGWLDAKYMERFL